MLTSPRCGDWSRRFISAAALAVVVAAGCGDSSTSPTAFSGFDGCRAGADSVVTFLQRTLDQIGEADPGEAAVRAPEFDQGIHALLLRAQEVHCTEEGFNDAVAARVDDLVAHGRAGELLIGIVRQRGLGSLEASRGGPIRLPAS